MENSDSSIKCSVFKKNKPKKKLFSLNVSLSQATLIDSALFFYVELFFLLIWFRA